MMVQENWVVTRVNSSRESKKLGSRVLFCSYFWRRSVMKKAYIGGIVAAVVVVGGVIGC